MSMTTNVVLLPGDDSGFPSSRPVYQIPDITTGRAIVYDADTLGAVASSVTSWANSAGAGSLGAGADLVQTSTSKPTVVDGPNGHKAVRAVGASSQYIRTAGFGTPLTLPMTQAFVLKRTSTGTQSIASGNFSTTSSFIGLNWATAGYGVGAGASAEFINAQANSDMASFHVLVVRHGASAMFSIDGVEVTGQTGLAAPTLATLPRVTLFTNSAASAQFASVDLAYAAYFTRALTDEDIRSLVATLKAKYAIA